MIILISLFSDYKKINVLILEIMFLFYYKKMIVFILEILETINENENCLKLHIIRIKQYFYYNY